MKNKLLYGLFIILLGTNGLLFADEPYYKERPPAGMSWGWQGHILFDFDKSVLRDSELDLLNRMVDVLQLSPHAQILLTGRTDNSGKLAYNQKLSERRNATIIAYLSKKGIETERIHHQAVGEQRPVADNNCRKDRRRNRSVDLALFPTGHPKPDKPELVYGETAAKQGKDCL